MLRQEFKKLWNVPMMMLVVLLCILTAVSAACTGRFDLMAGNDELYQWYLERWEGTLTQQKRNEIQEEQQMMDSIPDLESIMTERYLADEISLDEYTEYMEKKTYVTGHRSAFDMVLADVAYLEMEEMETGISGLQLFYSRYWNYYFQTETISYLLLIFVFAAGLRSYFMEKSAGMLSLLRSSGVGINGVMTDKAVVVGISAGAVTLLVGLIRMVSFFLAFDMPCPGAPLQSLPAFAQVTIPMSLMGAAFLAILLQMIGYALLAMLLTVMSMWVGREIPAAIAGLTLVFVPVMFGETLPWLKSYSLYDLLNGMAVIQNSTGTFGILHLGAVILIWSILAAFTVLSGSKKGI